MTMALSPCSATPAALRAGFPLDESAYESIRRRMVLDYCKWDPQVGDSETIGRFPLILSREAWEELAAMPPSGAPYVYVPLHFQPEMTTLVLAPFCVDQIAVIENVAKTLPIDHRLYVKEHKASLGRRPFGYSTS